jgi:hypothetical protein
VTGRRWSAVEDRKHDYVLYEGISAARQDQAGNLRLFGRRRFGIARQRVFHPASDRWVAVDLRRDGSCEVTLDRSRPPARPGGNVLAGQQ